MLTVSGWGVDFLIFVVKRFDLYNFDLKLRFDEKSTIVIWFEFVLKPWLFASIWCQPNPTVCTCIWSELFSSLSPDCLIIIRDLVARRVAGDTKLAALIDQSRTITKKLIYHDLLQQTLVGFVTLHWLTWSILQFNVEPFLNLGVNLRSNYIQLVVIKIVFDNWSLILQRKPNCLCSVIAFCFFP